MEEQALIPRERLQIEEVAVPHGSSADRHDPARGVTEG
jgi:hypothetical protein